MKKTLSWLFAGLMCVAMPGIGVAQNPGGKSR